MNARNLSDALDALVVLPGLFTEAHTEGYLSLHTPPDVPGGRAQPSSSAPRAGDLAARDAFRYAAKDLARAERDMCATLRPVLGLKPKPALAGLLDGSPSKRNNEHRRWRGDGIHELPPLRTIHAVCRHLAAVLHAYSNHPDVLENANQRNPDDACRSILRAEKTLCEVRGTAPQPQPDPDRRRPDLESALTAKQRREQP